MTNKLLPPKVSSDKKPITRVGLVLDLVFVAGSIWYTLVALEFTPTARHFPLFVGVTATVLALINLLSDARRYKVQERRTIAEETLEIRGSLIYIGWFAGFILLAFFVSLVPAATVFLAAYLRRFSQMSWPKIAMLTACTVGALLILSRVLNLQMPPGIFFTIQ